MQSAQPLPSLAACWPKLVVLAWRAHRRALVAADGATAAAHTSRWCRRVDARRGAARAYRRREAIDSVSSCSARASRRRPHAHLGPAERRCPRVRAVPPRRPPLGRMARRRARRAQAALPREEPLAPHRCTSATRRAASRTPARLHAAAHHPRAPRRRRRRRRRRHLPLPPPGGAAAAAAAERHERFSLLLHGFSQLMGSLRRHAMRVLVGRLHGLPSFFAAPSRRNLPPGRAPSTRGSASRRSRRLSTCWRARWVWRSVGSSRSDEADAQPTCSTAQLCAVGGRVQPIRGRVAGHARRPRRSRLQRHGAAPRSHTRALACRGGTSLCSACLGTPPPNTSPRLGSLHADPPSPTNTGASPPSTSPRCANRDGRAAACSRAFRRPPLLLAAQLIDTTVPRRLRPLRMDVRAGTERKHDGGDGGRGALTAIDDRISDDVQPVEAERCREWRSHRPFGGTASQMALWAPLRAASRRSPPTTPPPPPSSAHAATPPIALRRGRYLRWARSRRPAAWALRMRGAWPSPTAPTAGWLVARSAVAHPGRRRGPDPEPDPDHPTQVRRAVELLGSTSARRGPRTRCHPRPSFAPPWRHLGRWHRAAHHGLLRPSRDGRRRPLLALRQLRHASELAPFASELCTHLASSALLARSSELDLPMLELLLGAEFLSVGEAHALLQPHLRRAESAHTSELPPAPLSGTSEAQPPPEPNRNAPRQSTQLPAHARRAHRHPAARPALTAAS